MRYLGTSTLNYLNIFKKCSRKTDTRSNGHPIGLWAVRWKTMIVNVLAENGKTDRDDLAELENDLDSLSPFGMSLLLDTSLKFGNSHTLRERITNGLTNRFASYGR